MRYLRRAEGVTRMDRVTSEDIRRRLGVESVLEVQIGRRSGGRSRKCCERLVRRVFEEEVCGRRPRKRWREDT